MHMNQTYKLQCNIKNIENFHSRKILKMYMYIMTFIAEVEWNRECPIFGSGVILTKELKPFQYRYRNQQQIELVT